MKEVIIPYSIIHSIAQIDNVFEMRLFGWILAKAQSVLKLYNRDLSDINLQYALNLVRVTFPARYLLVDGDTNYKHIPEAFGLATKKVTYERDGIEYHLNIIAFPEFVKKGGQKMVTFVIHNELWHALLNFTQGYRHINLTAYMSFKSTYAMVFYMLISNQTRPITYNLDTLRKTTGADRRKAYARTGNFVAKVLEPSRRELDERSPWSFDYTLQKTGQAYTAVTIQPHRNESYTPPTQDDSRAAVVAAQRIRLDERVTDYLQFNYHMAPREIERIEGLLIAYNPNPAAQLTKISEVRSFGLRTKVANLPAYLTTCLKQATV